MSGIRQTPAGRFGHFGLGLTAALVLAFLMAPLIVIVLFSFKDSGDFAFPITGWSLKWYRTFFTTQTWMEALKNSLILAVSTTLLATPLGTMAALGLAAPQLPGRRLISAFLLIPMIAPVVIVGIGMYFVFSMAGLTATLPGLILGHTSLAVPFVVVTVSAALTGLDRRLLWAAASMGAPPFLAFRKVTLPAILPGVASGALFAFATSLDEVVVTMFLAGPGQRTLPREMFTIARDTLTPTIAAAATVLIAASIVLLIASNALSRPGTSSAR
ncbi:ABC transporter permease [Mesorhizobium humile]|uniref:ABC transporter permease n=1 Tax=Mesorhizobium humile TaxID=3072313 RepID=A0ABU4YCJ6_9HYPH|nr:MULTISPECIES: ABC transporter permease [unclassified Mesorhizobium]MDX8458870.1 ABC transporter permease [Mesorhizobium sp. VK2D]MDX8484652.1 ABC transporter permease [Mesorhizobium sp. VK2B]